jgi:dolichol-phosphate mannosyltransferase
MVINNNGSKEKNFISAVVYVYNNEATISGFLKKLSDTLGSNFANYEIICVNDASTDNSVRMIKEFADGITGSVVSIVNMSFFQGMEVSMNAGVNLSIGDFVFEFDNIHVDHEMDVIMQVYYHSLKGFDIVNAAANGKKRKTSDLFYMMFNRFSKNQYSLETETFRILSRRAINRIHSMSKTIPYRKAIYANCGLKMDTIHYDCVKGTDYKLNKQVEEKRKDIAINSMILFTDIAYRFSIIMVAIFLFAMFSVGIYTIVVYIDGTPVEGWTTTMLILTFAFLGMFMFFAIVIKYMSILTSLIFKKQNYIIESIEKITK